jgi:cytochrome c-type biogenesis protein CcmH
MSRALVALVGCMTIAVAPAAWADTRLPDPVQEARAEALGREIRCVVCENEPIAQSSAEIAADMRRVVRERIAAGDTDAEVRAWFADRYGAFVLLRPPVSGATLGLWGAPFMLLGIGAVAMVLVTRRKQGKDVNTQHLDDLEGTSPDDDSARAALIRAEHSEIKG